MHSAFLPESKYKHKDKMETSNARKGAASLGVREVFDITMLVAGWWPAAFREHQGWQVALRNTFRSIALLLRESSQKKCCHTGMANTVNLEQGYNTGTTQIV